MPPKASSSKPTRPQGPTKEALQAINTYLAHKPDFENLIKEAKAKENPNQVRPEQLETEYKRKAKEAIKEILEERREEASARNRTVEMPVHPKEEEAGSSEYCLVLSKVPSELILTVIDLTDKVAQESKDSGASDHPMHTKGLATMEDHKANPGPVMAENLGEPASKEELKKRAEELNKK